MLVLLFTFMLLNRSQVSLDSTWSGLVEGRGYVFGVFSSPFCARARVRVCVCVCDFCVLFLLAALLNVSSGSKPPGLNGGFELQTVSRVAQGSWAGSLEAA